MKRILILVFVLTAALAARSQVYVGGSLNIWGGDHRTTFSIAPEVGYNFNETWSVGGTLQYAHNKRNSVKSNSFAIEPYARYAFFENDVLRVFLDGQIGFSTEGVKGGGDNVNGFEIGIQPGLAIKATKHLSFLAKFGFLGYRDDFMSKADGGGLSLTSQDLSFGFYYSF